MQWCAKEFCRLLCKQMKTKNIYLFSISLSILLLSIFLISGLDPLFTSDSAAYLLNARELYIPMERPIFYSAFIAGIRELSQWIHPPQLFEIWGIQLLLISLGISLFIRRCFPDMPLSMVLVVLIFIGFLSPLPWFIPQLMPDIFTPILFLYACLFLMRKNTKEAYWFGCITLLCAVMHNSNLMILSLFSAGLFILYLLWKRKLTSQKFKDLSTIKPPQWMPFGPALKQLMLLSLLPWAVVIGSNIWVGNGFTVGKGSHVFFMGKLCENGILKKYLDEHCAAKPSPLCAFKDNLPEHTWDFVWDDDGILEKTGGWHHSNIEYNKIIMGTLASPKYLFLHVLASAKASVHQLLLTHAGDGIERLDTGGTLAKELKTQFPHDYQRFITNNTQQKMGYNFNFYNQVYDWSTVIILSVALLIILTNPTETVSVFFWVTFLFVLCNAFATATFANVLSRLNARDIWLLPMMGLLLILHHILERIQKKKVKQT